MVDIKIKTKERKFTVPIPYTFLNLFVSAIPTTFITRLINNRINNDRSNQSSTVIISPLDKIQLKQIIRELKKHKGTELVKVKTKDGSEITIRL